MVYCIIRLVYCIVSNCYDGQSTYFVSVSRHLKTALLTNCLNATSAVVCLECSFGLYYCLGKLVLCNSGQFDRHLFNLIIAVSFPWKEILWMRQVHGCIKFAVWSLFCVDNFLLVRVLCRNFKID